MKKRMHSLMTSLAIGAAVSLGAVATGDVEPSEYEMPSRVVSFSFIGGQVEPFRKALVGTKLIDEEGNWIAGDAHAVFMGNVAFDGEQVVECLELIRDLEVKAEEAGGKVHMLLGRMEFMLIRGDFTKTPEGNYVDLATHDSEQKMEDLLTEWRAELLEFNQDKPNKEHLNERFAERFNRIMKPGSVEYWELFANGAELGDWLRSRNAVIRIGDLLYSDGGLGTEYGQKSLDEVNNIVRADLNEAGVWVPVMMDNDSPIFLQEFAEADNDNKLTEMMLPTLRTQGAVGQVVGYSQILGESVVRGRLYMVGSGLDQDVENPGVLVGAMEHTVDSARFYNRNVWYKARVLGALPAPENMQ